MNKGKVVGSVPPQRKPAGAIDWDPAAHLARLSGQPVLAAQNVRNSRIKAVRQYTREPFITPEGRIVVQMRNSHVGDDGEYYADVYFTWKPNTPATEESK